MEREYEGIARVIRLDDNQVTMELPRGSTLKEILNAVERATIVRALRNSKGNKSEAARSLGIWRSDIYRRIENYDILRREYE